MPTPDTKANLSYYLQAGRDAIVWKLEGLSEYDARRPLVPTGTNLLGMVKHLATVESGYFGEVFDRPFPKTLPWDGPDREANADMWATADETRAELVGLYREVWAHADATIADLDLDHTGEVPWWPEDRRTVTLQTILVHMIAETHRHAGHADILREMIDGVAGTRGPGVNLPSRDEAWWKSHTAVIEAAAREAG